MEPGGEQWNNLAGCKSDVEECEHCCGTVWNGGTVVWK